MTKITRSAAEKTAQKVEDALRTACTMITVGGSIRRGESFVKDAEIIALPKDTTEFLGRLDGMVARGEAAKATYDAGKARWGERYRGLMINGVKVEVFIADPDNWGYILWLRTGPGPSNHEVMKFLGARKWPVRLMKSYAWLVDYSDDEPQPLQKLRVATETDLYALLGIDYLGIRERELPNYRRALHYAKAPSMQLIERLRVDAPKVPTQQTLF